MPARARPPPPRRGPAPRLGAAAPPADPKPARALGSRPPGLPFAGLRIVDLGTFWAGPYCTMYLGALGADVIKVESTRRPDGFRFSGAVPDMGADWYERGGVFQATNLDKRAVTLDLTTDEGRRLLRQLIEDADVVLENFSARVVEQFGLGYEQVRTVKPDVIMVRMPGFGLVGPWRDYVGWAMVIEQATGMASVTGPPERPMHPGGLADPVIGMHAAVAVQAALDHRERTGEGQLIEVAQLETGANLAAELVLEWSARRRAVPRRANRDPHQAPQGVYPCRPGERGPEWLALSVTDDAHWRALAPLVGRPDWLTDPALADPAGRQAHHDQLDAALGAWAADHDVADAVAPLVAAGIPPARVLTVPWMFDDPQLVARRYYVPLHHARAGTRRYPGWPARFSSVPEPHRRGAPTLGQHNAEVLAELGVTPAGVDALAAAGVIGDAADRPLTPVAASPDPL